MGADGGYSKRTFSQFSPAFISTMRSTLDIDPLGSFARGMLIVEILLCLLYGAVCIATNAPRAPTRLSSEKL
jgi:hypothetical protein